MMWHGKHSIHSQWAKVCLSVCTHCFRQHLLQEKSALENMSCPSIYLMLCPIMTTLSKGLITVWAVNYFLLHYSPPRDSVPCLPSLQYSSTLLINFLVSLLIPFSSLVLILSPHKIFLTPSDHMSRPSQSGTYHPYSHSTVYNNFLCLT